MKFKEAYDLIKKGFYIKLPSWGGYWSWDDDKETIMMHLKDNTTIMDIRDTTAVDYTLRNILSDEWIIATNENTPILGGENTFDFYKALEYFKKIKCDMKGEEILVKGFSKQELEKILQFCN